MIDLKRTLTAEEAAKPYAYLYDAEMVKPDEKALAQLSNRIPDEVALRPENVHDLFTDDPKNDVIGWTVFNDGIGYVSNRVEMPGVTPEMLAWWFAWHPIESLRYMIWYPARHFSIGVREEDKKKILDPAVPIQDKISDVEHIIQEDARDDFSLEEIPAAFQISFRKPADMGVSLEEIGFPKKAFFVCGSPRLGEDGSLPARPRIMLHYAKATDNGCVFYSRFWMGGYVLKDGKAVCVGTKRPVPESAPQGLLLHSMREYTHLASFLPDLYNLMQGKIED